MLDLSVRSLDFTGDETRPCLYGDCERCSLRPKDGSLPAIVRGFGVGNGIAIIGESPGGTEVERGQPFIGPSGRLIRTVLERCEIDPERVYWTNALLCRSPVYPPNADIVACNRRLHDELSMVQANKVLMLGKAALQALVSPTRSLSIWKYRGKGMWLNVQHQRLYGLATYHPAAVLRSTDLFLDLARDVWKFATHETPIAPPKLHVFVSWKAETAVRRLTDLMQASVLSCDIETTGFSVVGDAIVSIGFAVERTDGEIESHIIPRPLFKDPQVRQCLLNLINEFEGKLVLHNAKFDLRFMQQLFGMNLQPKQLVDTMLMSYVLDERSSSLHGLKPLSQFFFDASDYAFDFDAFFSDSNRGKQDWDKLFYYQGQDCYYTLQLYHLLRKRMDEETEKTGLRGDELLQNLLYPATLAFKDIENVGVLVDREYLYGWGKELRQESDELKAELQRMVEQSTGVRFFNPSSSMQVRDLVYKRWKIKPQLRSNYKSKQWKHEWGSGEMPTGRVVLNRITEVEPDPVKRTVLQNIIRWRVTSKLEGTYVKGYLRLTDSDSRIRPFFFLHGTVTGRLACASPNLQNVANQLGPQVEYAFRAPDGWSILKADFSQLELRVLAAFSNDRGLIETFKRGADIHAEAASRVFQKPVGKDDLERKLAKGHPVGTGILTPTGYRPIETLKAGDLVIGSNGQPTRLTGIYPRGRLPVFRVSFSDGGSVETDAEHLWQTTRADAKGRQTTQVVSTQEIAQTLPRYGRLNRPWFIPTVQPVQFEPRGTLPIPPYVLGVLLGDGSLTLGSPTFFAKEEDVPTEVEAELVGSGTGMRLRRSAPRGGSAAAYTIQPSWYEPWKRHVEPYRDALLELGLLWRRPRYKSTTLTGCRAETKFIPESYKFASVEARLALLQGLMDTDGGTNPVCSFVTVSPRLANDVTFLVESLGGTVRRGSWTPQYTYKGERRQGQLAYTLRLSLPEGICPFRAGHFEYEAYRRGPRRSIERIVPTGEKEVICLSVAAEDQLYVTEHFIVTHNTLVFGVLYGRGAESIALGHEMRYLWKNLGLQPWTIDEAKAFQRRLLQSFPGLPGYIEAQHRFALEHHYVETPTGRRRRFPFITPDNRGEVFRQAVNMPIQGTASDICLLALIKLHSMLSPEKARILLSIHDAIILEVNNECLEEVRALVTHTMQDVQLIKTDVPFLVDVHVGPRWGDAPTSLEDRREQRRAMVEEASTEEDRDG